MSERYPDEMNCPDCGLTVAGNKRRNKLRAHTQKAIAAGKGNAACAAPRPGSNLAEKQEARGYQIAAAEYRRAYWASRDRPSTVTAQGTAQPLRPTS